MRPEVSLTSNTTTFTWAASVGQKYRLQFKNDLSDPQWQTLGSDITATTPTVFTADTSLGTAPQRFYRLVMVN